MTATSTNGQPTQLDGQNQNAVSHRRLVFLFLGLALAAAMLSVDPPGGLSLDAWRVAAVTSWMVVWWLGEAIPIPATALLPIPLFPALGVSTIDSTTANYAHPLIFLFLGGFILAAAMQRSGLHRRIALNIINVVGSGPTTIIAGFMLATALLSMWISNTATTIMMYSVGLSVIELQRERTTDDVQIRNFSVALMLGIAYSASIGGIGTLIGTPPNALMASVLQSTYKIEVDFLSWMMFALPVVFVLLPITWVLLAKVLFPSNFGDTGPMNIGIDREVKALGPMRRDEKFVLVIFLLAATGWVFGKPISSLTGIEMSDTAVAIVAALLLFSVPYTLRSPKVLLDWDDAKQLPWGLLLIFGGGLAIASAFSSSGLAVAIGQSITGLSSYGIWTFVLISAALIVFLTEITSNTASAATFLPIFGAIAVGLGYDPRLLMIPITLGASMAFMMPVATPPNAVVFAHESVTITDMVRAGLWLNFASILVIFAAVYWLAGAVFGFDTSTVLPAQ